MLVGGKGKDKSKKGKKGGSYDDEGMAFYMYPIMAIDSPSGPLLHNLVMQAFTASWFTYTLLEAIGPSNKFLDTIKIIAIALAIIAAIISAVIMIQGGDVATNVKKNMGVLSFMVAFVAIIVGIISLVSHDELGLLAWLEGFVTLSNVFWAWRSAQQAS